MTAIGSNNLINTQMQANMPSPGVQANVNMPQAAQNQPQKTETVNDSFSYSEPPLNIGVLEGPSTYSKTPIADELQRRAYDSPMEKLSNIQGENVKNPPVKNTTTEKSDKDPVPSYSSKKKRSAGNLSALFAIASMVLAFSMIIPKAIYKLIKHK